MSTPERQFAVMVAAGGTGGHVFPALAVCEQLVDRHVPIIWLGTERGLESRVVPEAGIQLAAIDVVGFRGKTLWVKMASMLSIFKSVFVIWRLIARHRVAVVLGLGGYVSAAAGIAAFISRTPLLIQEQNAVAGTTNRVLARLASKIFAGFPGAFAQSNKVVDSGNPVRRDIVHASSQCRQNRSDQLHIAVIGGSLGALPINEVLPEAIESFIGRCGEMKLTGCPPRARRETQVRAQYPAK